MYSVGFPPDTAELRKSLSKRQSSPKKALCTEGQRASGWGTDLPGEGAQGLLPSPKEEEMM